MLFIEEKEINGKKFIYNYSDKYMIRKVGTDELYIDAYDPIEFKDERKYEESDIELPKENEDKEYM